MGGQLRSDLAALARLERLLPRGARGVLDRLREHGAQAVLVGGAVRDAYLGRTILDWDVATDALPGDVAPLFRRTARRGERHGTIMVLTRDGPVEVTTFRGEGPYADGRRPTSVHFHGDLEADLARRDFTINALAADLSRHLIVDPFGGRADLQARLVRCVGEPRERFSEDGLRPLRAVRFAAILGFEVEPRTAAALRPALPTLRQIAWERRRDELVKMLSESARLRDPLALMRSSGIVAEVAPELADAPEAASEVLERLPRGEPWLRLAAWALVAALDEEQATALMERLRVARRDQRVVLGCLSAARPMALLTARGEGLGGATLRRWLADHGVEGAMGAARIIEALDPLQRGLRARLRRTLQRRPPLVLRDLEVRGADLMEIGLHGPVVGRVLRQLFADVVERPSRNRRDWLLDRAHKLSTGEDR